MVLRSSLLVTSVLLCGVVCTPGPGPGPSIRSAGQFTGKTTGKC